MNRKTVWEKDKRSTEQENKDGLRWNRKRLAWCPGRKKGKTQEQDSGEEEQFSDTYK
jgi:hypothetical protein